MQEHFHKVRKLKYLIVQNKKITNIFDNKEQIYTLSSVIFTLKTHST